MSAYEPQVGDKIRVEGIVTHVNMHTLSISTPSGDNECVWIVNAELVERPKPKITIELTVEQARCIASCAEYSGIAVETMAAARIIREALDERS